MSLLRKPAPVIPKRQYHVRIQEPLALKMERYAEFLGAANIDHVIAEALDFVFRKDADFNTWLAENPQTGTPADLRLERKRAKPNGSGAAVDVPRTDRASPGNTI